MNLTALDLSLTSTGYASSCIGRSGDRERSHGLIVPPKGMTGLTRLRWIRNQVRAVASDAHVVVVEGYAFSAHASHAHELGELGGVVRMAFFEAGVPHVDVAPASLKKFASGKGNAKKEQVLADAVRKLEYAGHSTDEADALWLLRMAETHYGVYLATSSHQETLAKVPWPDLAAQPFTIMRQFA